MTQDALFDRRAALTLGTIRIAGGAVDRRHLRFSFDVTATLQPKPNTATIVVYNLTREHRSEVERADRVPCLLEGGYASGTSTLFFGNLRNGFTVKEGPDFLTAIGAGDGEQQATKARVQKSYAPNTPPANVLKDVALALGVLPGNLNEAVTKIRVNLGTAATFSLGTVLSGSASSEMTRVCRSLGLEWSIQQGKLQILERGKVLAGQAIFLNERSGLIESPTVDGKGILSCSMLLARDVIPGRLLVLDALRLKGNYRIEEVQSIGDTHVPGGWQHNISAKRY